jgi:hypothetical protein
MTRWEWFYYGVVAVALIVGSALLSACASVEGDGFTNGATPIGKACKQKTPTGERWFRC